MNKDVKRLTELRRDGREIAKAKQSERTRRKILKAAAIEFRNNGLSGARVSTIAKRAGMNVQALYHHFGSKDKLYTAVLEDVFSKEWQDSTSDALASMPPDEAMIYLWRHMFEEFGTDRTYIALLSDANTHRARHMKNLLQGETYFHRVIEEMDTIIARGETMGLFRKGLDAGLLYTLISGARATYLNNAYSLSAVLKRDLRTPEARDEWESFLFDFIVHGLRPTPEEAKSRKR